MRLRNNTVIGKPTDAFRKMLKQAKKPILGAGGGTAHHAQLAEASGMPFFGLSGAQTAAHILGLPDAGLLHMGDLVENARRICQAVSMPVIVDCDTGFGNAINVQRTVDEIIRTGAVGLFIEDQVAPKRCGHAKGKELISIEEAVGKFRSACDVRDRMDPSFLIMARTDARGAINGGMEEVFARGKAYLNAGVDSLFIEALQSREETKAVMEAFPNTILKLSFAAFKPAMTTAELNDFGPCLIQTNLGQMGSIPIHDFLQEFKVQGIDAVGAFSKKYRGHPLAGLGYFNLTGFPKVAEMENKYLNVDWIKRYEGSIGLYDPRTGVFAPRDADG